MIPIAIGIAVLGACQDSDSEEQANDALQPTTQASDDPRPTCDKCPGTYISVDEIEQYTQKAVAESILDQQVRDVEIGKAHVAIGLVHRTKLDGPAPNSVAEHDLVSEVYHVIDGSGTLVLGPELVDSVRRPPDNEAVRLLNGPGTSSASILDGVTYQLSAGDVVIIPAGTGHWFTKIDDHITYLMIRIDPDKVTPLKNELDSRTYLEGSAP
jgi:mannose-6-phosphate isomerase-like protein (cupin superfamily)